jgi:hypothetical protein
MVDPLTADQLFDADMEHAARSLTLVLLHRHLGLQVLEVPYSEGFHRPAH